MIKEFIELKTESYMTISLAQFIECICSGLVDPRELRTYVDEPTAERVKCLCKDCFDENGECRRKWREHRYDRPPTKQ